MCFCVRCSLADSLSPTVSRLQAATIASRRVPVADVAPGPVLGAALAPGWASPGLVVGQSAFCLVPGRGPMPLAPPPCGCPSGCGHCLFGRCSAPPTASPRQRAPATSARIVWPCTNFGSTIKVAGQMRDCSFELTSKLDSPTRTSHYHRPRPKTSTLAHSLAIPRINPSTTSEDRPLFFFTFYRPLPASSGTAARLPQTTPQPTSRSAPPGNGTHQHHVSLKLPVLRGEVPGD